MPPPRKLRFQFLRRESFAGAVLGGLLLVGGAVPAQGAQPARVAEGSQYQFKAGEALACQLRLRAIHHQQTHARWPDRQENFRNTNQAEIDVRYELMPIAQQDDGAWKIRLVLHRLEQLTCRDGERKQTHLARADHPTGGVDPYEVMKMSFKDYAKYRSSDESTNPPPPPPHFAEDLLAEPLLLKLAPDGVLQSFEDRPEFEQIAPGVKFKECLALVLPVLPGEELRPATAWTRTVPVDLPARPLNHGEVAPMALRLNYRVETIETVAGRRCARIRVNGHFAQDDLAIPIHQEVYRYLVWTKSVVRIEDELEGEFLFDLENHSMRRSSLRSVYQYSTISGRKEDQFRSRIREENVIETRLTQDLAPPVPGS